MAEFGFPRELRLCKSAEFDRVFAARASVADGNLIVHAAANELEHSRLGLAVSRRVGKAVQRNRWKRLIREAFRLSREELPVGYDFVVLPRRPQPPLLADLQQSLIRLARRASQKQGGRGK